MGIHGVADFGVRLCLGVCVHFGPLGLRQLPITVQGGQTAGNADLLIGQVVVVLGLGLPDVYNSECHTRFSLLSLVKPVFC